jgi:hypothetical protein
MVSPRVLGVCAWVFSFLLGRGLRALVPFAIGCLFYVDDAEYEDFTLKALLYT